MADQRLKVRSSKVGRLGKSFEPGIGNLDNWQRGARQIRSFFDDFLGGNPSWQNGLHQLQETNPSWARGAEQLGSFVTGTPMRRLPIPASQRRVDNNFAERDRRASARQRAMRTNRRPYGQPLGFEEQGPVYKSFADYLREAEAMLGGGGVNYDPQRNALRQNATQANDIIGAVYADLQRQFADAAPVIAQRYADSGEALDLNTAEAANAINSSNTAIRDEQTRQLAALGIEDAIGGVAPQQAADQAAALQRVERTGQIAGNANEAFGASAKTYNDENKGTAGMEGASKRALLQSNLLAALADVDAREQDANASLQEQRRQSALSIAQLLMEQDPEGAAAAAAQARQMQEFAQQQFENEMRVREFDAKYGQGGGGLGLQQVLNLIAQQSGGSLEDMDPKNLAALVNAYSRFQ